MPLKRLQLRLAHAINRRIRPFANRATICIACPSGKRKAEKKGTGPHGPSHDQKDGSHEAEFGNPTGGPPALVAGTQKGIFFGFGRMMLLKKIHEGQSLRSAAEFLGMSYRAAWSKIKDTEKVLGVALIEKTVGRRAGYRLTEDGLTLMTCFKHWFTYVERYALRRARRLLPCTPIAYKETPASYPVDPLDDPVRTAFLP